MDVDRRPPTRVEEVAREDLHVAREHDAGRRRRRAARASAASASAIPPSATGTCSNGRPKERDVAATSAWLETTSATSRIELAAARAPEQVEQAVIVADTRIAMFLRSAPYEIRQSIPNGSRHLALERELELRPQVGAPVEEELHPHQERPVHGIGRVLRRVRDVRPARKQPARHGRDDPGLVGADDHEPR